MIKTLTMAFTAQRIEATLRSRWFTFTALLLLALMATSAFAHGVAENDKLFIEQASGMQLIPFIYLGAKHMVTGYDHLLFLFGVIFFLYRMREVGTYVTPFAIGHSVTLLYGVLSGTHVTPTLSTPSSASRSCTRRSTSWGQFRRLLGFQPNTKAAHQGRSAGLCLFPWIRPHKVLPPQTVSGHY